MDNRIQYVAIVAAIGLFLLVLELVRRRRLLERYALLWLFSALILLVLAAWRGALEEIAQAVGIFDPPNALFMVAVGFILVLLLHFSVATSRHSDQLKVLAQRLALTEERLSQVEEGAPEALAADRERPTVSSGR